MTTEEIARLRALCNEKIDCGDSSCRFARGKGGMRTNGRCRCVCDQQRPGIIGQLSAVWRALPAALDEIERLRGVIDETHDRLMFVRVRMLGVLPFDRKANTIDEAIAALSDAWHGRAT